MTTSEIRETLRDVHAAVEVPPVDQVAFQARVRHQRRRRATGRAVAVGVAAAALVTGGVVAARVLDRTGSEVPVADGAAATGTVPETVWFVRDGRLTSLDPAGRVHRSGVRSEGVLGWTAERVYALGAGSGVVVLDQHGKRLPSPVTGAVQSTALSADGRYLAWMDLGHTVTVYDLAAGRTDFTTEVPRSSYVAAVSADGVLVSEDVDLVLHTADGQVPVPTQEAGDSWGAQVAGGRVAVAGADGRSRVYELAGGAVEPAGVLAGTGVALAPDGATAAAVEPTADDSSAVVHVWDGERQARLAGLDGVPAELRFADARTLLVTTGSTDDASTWACSTDDLTCGRLPVPAGRVRLGE